MRITINEGIKGYSNCQITVASWFCSQEGIIYSEGDIIKQTPLAILLKLKNKDVWIPKSLVEVHPIPKGLGDWQ